MILKFPLLLLVFASTSLALLTPQPSPPKAKLVHQSISKVAIKSIPRRLFSGVVVLTAAALVNPTPAVALAGSNFSWASDFLMNILPSATVLVVLFQAIQAEGKNREGDMKKLEARIDGLGAKVDGVQTNLSAKIDGVETNLTAGMKVMNSELSAKVDGVQTNLRADMTNLRADMTNLSAKIDGIETNLTTKIDGLETNLRANMKVMNSELSAKIYGIGVLESNVDGRLKNQDDKIENLEKSVNFQIEKMNHNKTKS